MSKKNTPREIVTARITEMRLTGQMKPGDQLPPERELATGMGISRNLCSDIIKELENKGLLVVIPRQGVFVNDFRADGNLYTMEAIMEAEYELLSSEIKSLLELRWAIEVLACKRIIQNASDEQISELGKLIDKVLEAKTPKQAALFSYEYYYRLAVLSENCFVTMITTGTKNNMVKLLCRYAQKYGTQQLYKSLAEVYFYIGQRDFEAAIKQISRSTTDIISGDFSIYKDI